MRRNVRGIVLAGLLVAVVLAGVMSHYASDSPDGLNRVAIDQGFADAERSHPIGDDSPFARYSATGVENDRLAGGLAGVAGVAVSLVLAGGLALVVRRRPTPDRGQGAASGRRPASTGRLGH